MIERTGIKVLRKFTGMQSSILEHANFEDPDRRVTPAVAKLAEKLVTWARVIQKQE